MKPVLPLLLLCAIFIWNACQPEAYHQSDNNVSNQDTMLLANGTDDYEEPSLMYGYSIDSFLFFRSIIGKNDFLSNILSRYNVDYAVIDQISKVSASEYDVRNFRAGKPYVIVANEDSAAQCFIYEANPVEYIVYDFRDPENVKVYKEQKEIEYRVATSQGIISSSLYQTLQEHGTSPQLAMTLSEIYAWTIDFYRIQQGDRYKVIYTEQYVDNEFVGIGEIKAAYFQHSGEDYYAFGFEQEGMADYFDEQANSLRKAFLKAPVKFSRISSKYNPRRLHPVLKKVRAHLGTDYAAAHGTPIMTTGDGTVIEASYTSGNGNYVKVRHNSTYTTQYLHISKFASGIQKGKRVRQGDIIGYVGSTGLATGPHVCYRFWKNNRQVDPLKESIPPSEPVKAEFLEDYKKLMFAYKKQLDNMQFIPREKPLASTDPANNFSGIR